MKTIKQIADEIGVSKQAIQQRLKREPLASACRPLLAMVGGVWQVPPEAEMLILSAFNDKATSETDKQPTSVADNVATNVVGKQPGVESALYKTLEVLQEQLKTKDAQIELLQKSLERTTIALQDAQATAKAAQALHAGTIHGQLSEKPKQEPPPITPEPKPAAVTRPTAPPTRSRPQEKHPVKKKSGIFNWLSNRI